MIHERSQQTEIIVLCYSVPFSAGVGRTGVFCALCILIERLKSEAVIDVFQAVKQLREQRPAMVQTKVKNETVDRSKGFDFVSKALALLPAY